MPTFLIVALVSAAAILQAPVGASAADLTGRASVIDGDTIEIHGQRIRLHGIDAPEGRQECRRDGRPWRCGTEAANALAGFLGARTVTCRPVDVDRYKRVVARCSVADEDLSAWLVRQGWALDYARYSRGEFQAQQAAAQKARAGVWAGELQPPWEWRASNRR